MNTIIKVFLILLTFAAMGCTRYDIPLSSAMNGSSGSGGTGQIQLSWTAVQYQQTGFKIEVSADGGTTYNLNQTVPDGTTSATLTGLVAGQTYSVRVKGYSEGGDSVPSAVITAQAH